GSRTRRWCSFPRRICRNRCHLKGAVRRLFQSCPIQDRSHWMSECRGNAQFKMMRETPPTKRNDTRKGTGGGASRGAGRPRSRFAKDAPHRARPELSSEHAVHVTLRTMLYVPRLRQSRSYHAIREVLGRYLDHPEFRVVHISIQSNHIHMVIEAANK